MDNAIDTFDKAYRQKQLRANRVLESLRLDPTSMQKDNALDEAIWELSKQRLAVHEAVGGIRTYEKRVKKVSTAGCIGSPAGLLWQLNATARRYRSTLPLDATARCYRLMPCHCLALPWLAADATHSFPPLHSHRSVYICLLHYP